MLPILTGSCKVRPPPQISKCLRGSGENPYIGPALVALDSPTLRLVDGGRVALEPQHLRELADVDVAAGVLIELLEGGLATLRLVARSSRFERVE